MHTPQAVKRNNRIGHHGVAEQLPELIGLVFHSGCAASGELCLLGDVGLLPFTLLALAFRFGGARLSC
ncbi:hypothetical protein [Streptomyces noursei]|uniref:hypothetical protein n=1 Tax=Streptomyces noursei TaxID=1971 RepID=UPI0023B77BC5|nr:hypothetical protein [Streptomyces noursei]